MGLIQFNCHSKKKANYLPLDLQSNHLLVYSLVFSTT